MTGGVYQRFEATGFASRDRFEAWRSWCMETIDVPMRLEPVGRPPLDFDASIEALVVGDVDFVEYRSGPAIGSWTRDAAQVSDRLRLMMLAPTAGGGGVAYGEKLSLEGGATVLLGDTGGLWHNEERLHGVQVNVPRAMVHATDAQLASFNDQRRLCQDPVFTGLVRPALSGLGGHLESLAAMDVHELQRVWISLVTMLTRSLAGRDTGGVDTAPARRLQMTRYIRKHLADPRLSPETIAAALHVSRSTLYATLPEDSEGVAAEIRRHRLERAHAILRDPTDRRSIAEVGAAVGMPRAAHFSRAFRERFGATPKQVRAGDR